MNARKLILAISLMSILSISASASAQQKSENTELVARLERLASESDQKVRTLNGGPKQKWLLHEMRVRRLIDKLKSGQSVDPKEIDEILKEHSR
jgi:ABC-type sugar transport system ATPase subunit